MKNEFTIVLKANKQLFIQVDDISTYISVVFQLAVNDVSKTKHTTS
jgi:hypothetical protein